MVEGGDKEEEKMVEMTIAVVRREERESVEERLKDLERVASGRKNGRLCVSALIEHFSFFPPLPSPLKNQLGGKGGEGKGGEGKGEGGGEKREEKRMSGVKEGEEEEWFVAVWEVVEGVDMSTQVLEVPITTLISKLISTVKQLHDMNIFHGDISSQSTLFLPHEQSYYLTRFPLFLSSPSFPISSTSTTFTFHKKPKIGEEGVAEEKKGGESSVDEKRGMVERKRGGEWREEGKKGDMFGLGVVAIEIIGVGNNDFSNAKPDTAVLFLIFQQIATPSSLLPSSPLCRMEGGRLVGEEDNYSESMEENLSSLSSLSQVERLLDWTDAVSLSYELISEHLLETKRSFRFTSVFQIVNTFNLLLILEMPHLLSKVENLLEAQRISLFNHLVELLLANHQLESFLKDRFDEKTRKEGEVKGAEEREERGKREVKGEEEKEESEGKGEGKREGKREVGRDFNKKHLEKLLEILPPHFFANYKEINKSFPRKKQSERLYKVWFNLSKLLCLMGRKKEEESYLLSLLHLPLLQFSQFDPLLSHSLSFKVLQAAQIAFLKHPLLLLPPNYHNNSIPPLNNSIPPLNNSISPLNNSISPLNNSISPLNNSFFQQCQPKEQVERNSEKRNENESESLVEKEREEGELEGQVREEGEDDLEDLLGETQINQSLQIGDEGKERGTVYAQLMEKLIELFLFESTKPNESTPSSLISSPIASPISSPVSSSISSPVSSPVSSSLSSLISCDGATDFFGLCLEAALLSDQLSLEKMTLQFVEMVVFPICFLNYFNPF